MTVWSTCAVTDVVAANACCSVSSSVFVLKQAIATPENSVSRHCRESVNTNQLAGTLVDSLLSIVACSHGESSSDDIHLVNFTSLVSNISNLCHLLKCFNTLVDQQKWDLPIKTCYNSIFARKNSVLEDSNKTGAALGQWNSCRQGCREWFCMDWCA